MKVGTAHSSSQNSHWKGLCHCATSAGTHLFKYCRKLRPLFQERKRNKMGFFNPSFHLVSNKPSLKGRSADTTGLGSQSILLLQRYPQAWAFPPGSETLPEMEQHVPSDDSCCCPKQLRSLSKVSQPWIFLRGYTEITRTQKSCSYKGKVGERSREFSLFVGPQASPYLLTSSLTQPDPCLIAVIISPQVLNPLEVLNIHSTQSNSTHVRYWGGNSRTFKSFWGCS